MCWRWRSELREARPACGLVLFSYLNPVVRMGMKAFCAAARDAGADGVLLTDMIVEEAGEYLAEMEANAACARLSGRADQPGCAAACDRRRLERVRLRNLASGHHGHAGYSGKRRRRAGGAAALSDHTPGCGRIWDLQRGPRTGGRRVCRCCDHRQRAGRADRKSQPPRTRQRLLATSSQGCAQLQERQSPEIQDTRSFV